MSAFPPVLEKYLTRARIRPEYAAKYAAARRKAWEAVATWNGEALYNPEFVELKLALDSMMEDHWNDHPPLPERRYGITPPVMDLVWMHHPALISLSKSRLPAKLAAIRPEPEEAALHAFCIEFFQTWQPVSEQLTAIREKVIKGRRPSEKKVAEEKFRALPTTIAAKQLIAERITEITSDWRKAHAEAVAKAIQAVADRYSTGKLPNEGVREFWARIHEIPAKREAAKAVMHAYRPKEREQLEAAEAAASRNAYLTEKCAANPRFPISEGHKEAAFFIDGFIAKAQQKLGFVSGRLTSLTASPVRPSASKLECTLHVQLTHGAFEMRNQIVWSYSPRGKPFARYPSTFHRVTAPDGSKHQIASEEEMNGWFPPAGAVSPAVHPDTELVNWLEGRPVQMPAFSRAAVYALRGGAKPVAALPPNSDSELLDQLEGRPVDLEAFTRAAVANLLAAASDELAQPIPLDRRSRTVQPRP